MSESGTRSQRDPQESDLQPVLTMIWEGKSLSAACRELGLHIPSTSAWLHADEGREAQYMRAREGRAEFLQEDALTVNRAAAMGVKVPGREGAAASKVDPSGAKGYLEAVKFAIGRMAPKTMPIQRVEHTHDFGELSDEEIDRRIAAKLAGAAIAFSDDDEAASEPEA